ncbi:hypothetical protein BDQ17DRAFT_1430542 [Cyathus striatus]|nr:hypothetical protein BDQ17DRAFT_1430542 [Cyathus striatus]
MLLVNIHAYDTSEEDSSKSHNCWDDSDSDSSTDVINNCPKCGMYFSSEWLVNCHLAEYHHWCFMCSRGFSSANALQNHCNSSIHSNRTFDCPFCNRVFTAPSAIAQHIESGCHKINRHQVTAAVHALKIIPQISVQKRITGRISPPTKLFTYTATKKSFNGKEYECFLCHRTFRSLDALNRHLNSPAHDADEFKCPGCKKKFKLISGLVQHIESGSCGVAKFKAVANHFDSLTANFSRMLKM